MMRFLTARLVVATMPGTAATTVDTMAAAMVARAGVIAAAVIAAFVVGGAAACTPTIACDPDSGDDTCPAGFTCGSAGVCVDDAGNGDEGEGEGNEGEGDVGEGEGDVGEGEGDVGEGEGEGDPAHAVADGAAGCCGLQRFRVAGVPRAGLAAGFVNGEIVVALESDANGIQIVSIAADGAVTHDVVDDGNKALEVNMAVDRGGGKPHIAYFVDNGGTDIVRHAVRQNDLWFADTVSAQEFSPEPQIAIDEDSGLPWVAFTDVIFGLVQVVEFTGDAWEKHSVTGSGTTGMAPGRLPDLVVAGGEATVVFGSVVDGGFGRFGFENVNNDFTLASIDDTHLVSEQLRVAASQHASGDLLVGYGGADNAGDQALAAFVARRHAGVVTFHLVDDSAALATAPIVEEGAAGVWAAYALSDGADGNIVRLAHADSADDVFTASTVADDGPFAGIDMTLDDNGMPIVVLSRFDHDDLEIARAP